MARWWDDYPRFPKPQPRRPAKDGIKARSRRGEIGESWWSKRFIAALQALTDPRRLGRGRSYARTGQVMDLRIKAGLVIARVQGSRRNPYDVRIAVKPLSEAQWARAEEAMAGQAIFLAALLAGEMPRDIEDAFTAAGLSLFPARPRDLETDCSCPDWANPCKHVAATLYILAEAFDEDPFLIFAWRGRAKDELIERLRERRAGPAGAGDPGAAARDAGAGPAAAAGEEAPPLAASLADFWRAGAGLAELRLSPRAAEVPDALLRQLGPAPVEVRGTPLDALLAPAYRTMAAAAERRAFPDET